MLVTMNDGVEKEGQLLEVGEQEITLEWTEGKGKSIATANANTI